MIPISATAQASRAAIASRAYSSRSTLDAAGALIVGALIAWSSLAAAFTGTSARRPVMGLIVLVGVYGAARSSWRIHPLVVPLAVVGVAAALWMVDPGEMLGRSPGGYPFGYANAKGEFLVHAGVAAFLVGFDRRAGAARLPLVALAAATAVLPFAFGSHAAGTLGLLAIAVALLAVHPPVARVTVVLVGALFAFFLSVTLVAGTQGSTAASGDIGGVLSERRVMLWHEATGFVADDPVTGIGFERFEQESPAARAEEDIRWIPNAFLEAGVEAGVVYGALLALLVGWGFVRLYLAAGPSWVVALGAASWGAMAIHACMDYTLHFPAIPLVAAGILGAATSDAWE